jgi:predicted histone-like DNA-binding protein
MLTYKLVEKGNPSDSTVPKKHYANHVGKGKKTFKDIKIDIEDKSSLTSGDVGNALENLVKQIPKYLLDGQSVCLGELGTFRLSISSEGAATPEEFDVGMIKNVKIIFTPGVLLKEAIAKAKFEKA